MYRGSNDEVAELAASKVGVKLNRIFMKDTGLDIYGTSLIVKDDDVKKRPEFVRAYVEATLEGLRYARDNQEEALKILLKHKPELDQYLATVQLKNALTEVFLPLESVSRHGLHEAGYHGKNRQGRQRVFRCRPQSDGERSIHQPVHQAITGIYSLRVPSAAADRRRRSLPSFYRRREDRYGAG